MTDILLTGATGSLGHYLLAELLSRTQARVRVLASESEASAAIRLGDLLDELGINLRSFIDSGRVRFVRGRLPDALDPSGLAGIDTVLHAAANTAFVATGEGEPEHTNVRGTAALLAAAAHHGVRHFVQISTAFVCGDETGLIAEEFSESSPPFCNDYERSKWQAEQLVRGWANDQRQATICRPSILFGDAATGRTTSADGVYLIARATDALARAVRTSSAADQHTVPLRILGSPSATCNLVPVDFTARRIVSIITDPAMHGCVHHITNSDPPTHADIKRWLEEYFDIGGGTFSNEHWPLSNPNHYEELFYALGNVVQDYFRDGLVFASRADGNGQPKRRLIDRDDFLRSLRYAHSRKWGRKRPAASCDGVDPEWYFEHHLADTIAQSRVARVHNLTTVVTYTIDAAPDEWTCTFDKGRLTQVVRGQRPESVEFGFTITRNAFNRLVTGEWSPQQVFLDGHADISGDVERALRMVPIIAEYIDEYPVPLVEAPQ